MTQSDAGTVVAIASAKGGVGKTTTAINLGSALTIAAERRVVLVDMDLAMANILDFLNLDLSPSADTTLHDVLAGSGNVSDSIYEAPGGIDVLPSGPRLDEYAETDPDTLVPVLDELRADYEIVIVDTGAGLSYETILPIALADAVLLVSTPRLAAVRDTRKTLKLAHRIGTPPIGLVLVKDGTGDAPAPAQIADTFEVPLCGHIPADEAVPAAQDAGVPIFAHAFASPAAKAYWNTAEKADHQLATIAVQSPSGSESSSDLSGFIEGTGAGS